MATPFTCSTPGPSNGQQVTGITIDLDTGGRASISIDFTGNDIDALRRGDAANAANATDWQAGIGPGSEKPLAGLQDWLKKLLTPLGDLFGARVSKPAGRLDANTPSPKAQREDHAGSGKRTDGAAPVEKTVSNPVVSDDIPAEFSTAAPAAGQSISKEDGDKLGLQVMAALQRDFGFTPEQAAGVVGNLYHESGGSSDASGLNPHLNEHGSNPGGYGTSANPTDPAGPWASDFGPPNDTMFGYGWAQWTAERKTEFLDWADQNGLDPGSPAANYGFLAHELKNKESQTVPAVKSAETPQEAADSFLTKFERAAIPVGGKRQEYADHFLELWNAQGQGGD